MTLAATLSSIDKVPVAGLVLLLGVDRFINEARAVVNLIGNGVATIFIARWEGALDLGRAKQVLAGASGVVARDVAEEIVAEPSMAQPGAE